MKHATTNPTETKTMTTTNANATTLACTFRKQGGLIASGTLIGRQGTKKLLVAYQIQSGASRERWLPTSRVETIDGDVASLPKWTAHTMKAELVATPLVTEWHATVVGRLDSGNAKVSMDECGPSRDDGSDLPVKTCPNCGNAAQRKWAAGGNDQEPPADAPVGFRFLRHSSVVIGYSSHTCLVAPSA